VRSRDAGHAEGSDVFTLVAGLPGVVTAVELARRAVDDLRGHRVLRRYSERVSRESALRGARASAALEGPDLPLEVVRRTATADRLPADPLSSAPDPVVQGALRVAAEVAALQPVWAQAPAQALARLHTLAAAGLVRDPDNLGRPVPGAVDRMRALTEALLAPTQAPALVVAAVVHGELMTMGAFRVGTGLVARAAARLTVIGRGLDPAAISVPEVGHVELGRPAYDAAVQAYADGGPDGIAAWVGHCAQAVVLGAREGVAVCEAIQRG